MDIAILPDFDPVAVLDGKSRELAHLQGELRRLKSAFEEAAAKPPPTSAPSLLSQVPLTTKQSEPVITSKERKLKDLAPAETISTPHTAKLKEVFQQYASIQTITLMDKMELAQFRRFIKDAKLVPQVSSMAQADIFFFHKNKGKNVTFVRWVQILNEFAKVKYAGGEEVLEQLVNEVILTASAIRAIQLPVANWRDRMEDATLQLELRKALPLFDLVFHTFCSLETGANGQLPIDDYIQLANECHLVPELLSMRDLVKVFRAVQRDAFSDLLSREEFYTSMACLALQVFGEKGNGEAVGELSRWLEKSVQDVKVLALRKGRTNPK